jgi:hypothetical protein
MIFVSTGGEKYRCGTETALYYWSQGIRCVELSGGSYSPTLEADLSALPDELTLQIHNYFPPPQRPFVFNLASTDELTANISMAHVRSAIRMASRLCRPIYSFHAGFRLDPAVTELGNKLQRHALTDRRLALEVFGDRLSALAEEARQEGVSLLVENNVLNQKNFEIFGENPLLLTHPDEIYSFMNCVPSNVGLLMDVAHLKVSSHTESFDLVAAHERIKRFIKAYHLSDNDGASDSNEPVSENSWFWNYLVRGLDYYSLEVYKEKASVLIEQCNLIKKNLLKASLQR